MEGGSQASWKPMSNQGSGPGDRLTYVEFQNRLAGFGVNSLKYLDLISPGDDMDEAYPKLENVDDTIFRNTKYKGYFDANDQDRAAAFTGLTCWISS